MLDVESQRVNRPQRSMSHVQRELRQIRHFRFYDHVRLGRLEACARKHLGNDLTAYNQRFQELTMLCTKMVLEEEDQVEKNIGGLLDNIQGNVIAVEPTRLQDTIRIANNLIDQKLKGYAIKNAENKRRFDNNSRDNRGQQQQPFKRQNVNGQNVARAYTFRNNVERRGYGLVGEIPRDDRL
ncbi:hypothetical protein Tco_1481201 [Tanacetum coccineum]